MGNSKVILGNETLIDLTGDTVSANNLLSGATAHDRSGTAIQGAVTVPSALDDLTDVDITTPTDGQVLKYDSATQKWVNGNGGGGGGGFVLSDWLTAGGLNPMSYADLAAVLADEEAVRRLMTIHLAVDYLAGQTAVDASINTILTDNTCAKWINLRDYALDTLYDNALFKTVMDAAGKYFLGEWALMPQVPKMTSNTAPYGTAFASSEASSYPAYNAFDGNASTIWRPSAVVPCSVGYQSADPICVKRVKITHHTNTQLGIREIEHGKIQGSNDGTNWVDISADFSAPADSTQGSSYYVDCGANNAYYSYHRVYASAARSSDNYVWIADIQFYAWAPKGTVPIMTSNTAPYGEAFGSSVYSSYYYYKPFDDDGANNSYWSPTSNSTNNYIGYKFVNPVCVKRFMYAIHINDLTSHPFNMKLQASNDGTNWTDLTPYKYIDSSVLTVSHAPYYINVDNDNYYLQYRIFVPEVMYSSSWGGNNFWALQFYGREMKVSVPVMTSNTAPYGEVIYSTEYNSTYAAWKAFNNSSSDGWASATGDIAGAYVGYHFPQKVLLKKVLLYAVETSRFATFKIKGSNDGSTWTELSDTLTYTTGSTYQWYDISADTAYNYIIVYGLTSTASGDVSARIINFYGLDYSEYDWDADNPRHYLYDHGVELTPLIIQLGTGTGAEVIKTPYSFIAKRTGFADFACDFSSYNLLRMRIGANYIAATYSSLQAGESTTTTSALAYQLFSAADKPNNCAVDISSVSVSGYAKAYADIQPGSNTNGTVEGIEMWLE